MASGNVSSVPPANAEWIPMTPHPVEFVDSGKFAVAMQSAFPNLQFIVVEEAWLIMNGEGYGNLHLLNIKASAPGVDPSNYEAIVWVKPTNTHPRDLLSFREMASGHVSGPPPKDALWKTIQPNTADIVQCGEFAVATQQAFPPLKFNAVECAWEIKLASGFGKLHLLILIASAPGIKHSTYQTIVWMKSGDFPARELLSFREQITP